jgi:hypothetical protein
MILFLFSFTVTIELKKTRSAYILVFIETKQMLSNENERKIDN